MGEIGGLSNFFHGVARAPLVSGVTPLERGPVLDSGAKLWVKRDDLTGLGVGGNKVRKLEFLCGAAQAENSLSRHCWCWSIESLPHDGRCWGVARTRCSPRAIR